MDFLLSGGNIGGTEQHVNKRTIIGIDLLYFRAAPSSVSPPFLVVAFDIKLG
jgi:hypothetical protein